MGEEDVTIKCPTCGDCDLTCDNCEFCGTVPMEEELELVEGEDEDTPEPFEPAK